MGPYSSMVTLLQIYTTCIYKTAMYMGPCIVLSVLVWKQGLQLEFYFFLFNNFAPKNHKNPRLWHLFVSIDFIRILLYQIS